MSSDRILVLAPSIPHFKGFGMRNLQYEIRICLKSHNTVTITIYMWTVVQILMKQTLSIKHVVKLVDSPAKDAGPRICHKL